MFLHAGSSPFVTTSLCGTEAHQGWAGFDSHRHLGSVRNHTKEVRTRLSPGQRCFVRVFQSNLFCGSFFWRYRQANTTTHRNLGKTLTFSPFTFINRSLVCISHTVNRTRFNPSYPSKFSQSMKKVPECQSRCFWDRKQLLSQQRADCGWKLQSTGSRAASL